MDLLQLQGGGWKVQSLNYDAEIISIQDLLLNLTQISLEELVTNNPDHHERFHLLAPPEEVEDWNENRHGLAVSLLRGDGTAILSLLIGKKRANGQGQYVRQRGSNKIPDLLDNKHLSLDLKGHPERFAHPEKYFPKNIMWEYRSQSQGLLIIYIIDGHEDSTQTNSRESVFADGEERQNIVSLGVVFPTSVNAERANYVAVMGVPPGEY